MSPAETPLLSSEEIDFLMSGPVKERPSIILVGDEDMVGFTPAPPATEPPSFQRPKETPKRGFLGLRFWRPGR